MQKTIFKRDPKTTTFFRIVDIFRYMDKEKDSFNRIFSRNDDIFRHMHKKLLFHRDLKKRSFADERLLKKIL